MALSIKQAAKILNVSREEVVNLIDSGKLIAERTGKGLTINELGIGALFSRTNQETEGGASGRPRQVSLPEMLIRPLAERIAALEKGLSEKLDLLSENKRLEQEIRQTHLDITVKDKEIEKLKGDLLYQKKLMEKEIEERMRLLDEKWALLERGVSERIAQGREEFEKTLQAERTLWSERLVREQERFEAEIAESRAKQSFWTRLMKMLTWS